MLPAAPSGSARRDHRPAAGEAEAAPGLLVAGPERRVLTSSCGAAPGQRGRVWGRPWGWLTPLPPQPDQDSRLLPLLVCLRVLFIPLFMLCHVPQRSRLPTLFPQDAYFITFMMVFALSNGYLVSLTMCLAPRSGAAREGLGGGAG